MSKSYVKNVNGKWRLTDKQDTKNEVEEPQIIINQDPVRVSPDAKAWVREIQETPAKVKELEERLKRVESFLFLAGTNKQ